MRHAANDRGKATARCTRTAVASLVLALSFVLGVPPADAQDRSGDGQQRRDLRRQINEAGMEVYSNTPRR